MSVIVDLHSSGFVSRGRVSGDEVITHKPENATNQDLIKVGTKVDMTDKDHTICDILFYVCSHIPRESAYEKGIPGLVTLVGGKWVLDEEIADGRGLVVFSACSHAGINKVCRDALRKANDSLFGVIG